MVCRDSKCLVCEFKLGDSWALLFAFGSFIVAHVQGRRSDAHLHPPLQADTHLQTNVSVYCGWAIGPAGDHGVPPPTTLLKYEGGAAGVRVVELLLS